MSDALPTPEWARALAEDRARLNAHQRAYYDAIQDRAGARNRRVLAAAGSGKTRSTVVALADALNSGVYRPDEVVLTTFTKKAAGEMEERLKRYLDPRHHAGLFGSGIPRVGTFHRVLGAWLRQNADRLPHAHRWNAALNLEATIGGGRESERQARQRERDEAVRRAFGDRVKPAQVFKRKAWVYDDILSPEKDAWKFRDLRISNMPLGIPEWMAEHRPNTPIPKGGDYALAVGLIVSRGLRPTTRLEVPLVVPSVEDEDVVETYPTVRAYADALGETLLLPKLYEAWVVYETIKERLGAWDFDDVIQGFYEHGTLGASLVIVDEGQDNSWVQLACARRLIAHAAGTTGKQLVLIGDVRQAIYGWRGAAPTVMRDADETVGYDTLTFPVNYRSGSEIVRLGNEICYDPSPVARRVLDGAATAVRASWAVGEDTTPGRREDPARLRYASVGTEARPETLPFYPSALQTTGPRTEVPRGTVRVLPAADTPLEEARTIGDDIQRLVYEGVAYSDVAILCRTNALGALLEIGCLLQKLPVLRVSRTGRPFFEEPVVSDVLAYLRAGIRDDGTGILDIANTPRRGIYTGKLRDALRGRTLGARAILDLIRRDRLVSRDYEDEVPRLQARLDEIRAASWSEAPLWAIQTIAPQYGADADSDSDSDSDSDTGPAVDVEEDTTTYDALVEICAMFGSLPELERFVARLATESKGIPEAVLADMTADQKIQFDEDRKRRILLCTIHAGKGLEWGFVYLPCSAGSFPSARSTTPARLAEERRLFYVGVTRAIDGLTFSYSEHTGTGKPAGASTFLATWVDPHLRAVAVPRDTTAVVTPDIPVDWTPRTGDADAGPDGSTVPLGFGEDPWDGWEGSARALTDPPLSWVLQTDGTAFVEDGILVYTLPDGTTRSGVRTGDRWSGTWEIRAPRPDGSSMTLGVELSTDDLFDLLPIRTPFPDPAWEPIVAQWLRRHPGRTVTFGGHTLTWATVADGIWPPPAASHPPGVLARRSVTLVPATVTELLTRRPSWRIGVVYEGPSRTVGLTALRAPYTGQEGTRIQVYRGEGDVQTYQVTASVGLIPMDPGRIHDGFTRIEDEGLRRVLRILWYGTQDTFEVVVTATDAAGQVVSSLLRSPSWDLPHVTGDLREGLEWFIERQLLVRRADQIYAWAQPGG